MPRLVAYEDAQANAYYAVKLKGGRTRIPFMTPTPDTPNEPTAFLSRQNPGRVIDPHFHVFDQWQIVVEGKGTLGRDEVVPYTVHFTRAHTPYGPLVTDEKTQLGFFVLFPCYQPGARYLPGAMEELKQIPDRRPWHFKGQVTFPSQVGGKIAGEAELREIPGAKDDHGLAAYSLAMAPNTEIIAPDPSQGGGQYIIALKGSFRHENKEYGTYSLMFAEPGDGAFRVRAGAEGLEAVILGFPRSNTSAEKTASVSSGQFKIWECELCAFVYDEAKGLPEEGIAPGTKWADVPDSWSCPDCSASKSDFRMVEIG